MCHLSQAPLSILYFFRVRRNICKFLGLLTPTIFHFQNVKGITLHVSPCIQSLSGVYRIVLSCHISADHAQCICSYGFDIYSSAIYVLQVQHRSNWQFSRKSAQRRWKAACSLTRWRETGIWKRNKNLKAPQRDEDLFFSKRLFQICFFQQESKK